MKKFKKLTSLVLILVMAVTMLPLAVFAEDGEQGSLGSVTVTLTSTGSPFIEGEVSGFLVAEVNDPLMRPNLGFRWLQENIGEIANTTTSSIQIPTDLSVGHHIFTVEVVDLGDNSAFLATDSETLNVEAPAPAPVIQITSQPQSVSVNHGSIVGNFLFVAINAPDIPTFQWFSNTTPTNVGGTLIGGATEAAFPIPAGLSVGTHHFYVVVSAGTLTPVTSNVATVTVNPSRTIQITTQPSNATVTQGNITGNLSVAANVTGAPPPTFQWFSNTALSNDGGTPIAGATGASLPIPTHLTVPAGQTSASFFFFVEVRAEGAISVRSNAVTVTVNPVVGNMTITPAGDFTLNRTGSNTSRVLTATNIPAGQTVTWTLESIGAGAGTGAVTLSPTTGATTTVTAVNAVHHPVRIVATAGNQRATVYARTTSATVQSVAITGGNRSMGPGTTLNLAATVLPASADQRVTWYSSNTAVATVNRVTGVVTATAGPAGRTAVITARSIDGGVTSLGITITTTTVSAVTISHTGPGGGATTGNIILPRTGANNNRTLTAATVPAGEAVTWSIEAVGTGSGVGTGAITMSTPAGAAQNVRMITAVDAVHYPVRVVATSGGQRGVVYVWTSSGTVSSVAINAGNHGMPPSSSVDLTASVLPGTSDQRVTWYSSNPDAATVDRITGRVTSTGGETTRTTTITARSIDGGVVSPGVVITVSPSPVTGVNIAPSGNFTLGIGYTRELSANVLPAALPEAQRAVTWRSLNTAVATVNNNGVVTGVSSGTAVIEVVTTTGQRTARVIVTVGGRIAVTGVSFQNITGGALQMTAGQSRTLTPVITPSNATNTSVTWHSNNTHAVSVSSAGLLTANAAGTATITLTSEDDRSIRAYLTVTVVAAERMFNDVPRGSWFETYVERVVNAGLFAGVGGGNFNPNGTMNRAMFAVVIARYERANVSGFVPMFNDVAPNEWYSREIAWAAANGIITGLGNNNFGPYDPVTREQMAVMLHRYVQLRGIQLPQGTPIHFVDDASISYWARDAVRVMQQAGIMQGDAAGRVNPQASATRAEVSAIFSRLLDIVPR